jgi:hypothetical protein
VLAFARARARAGCVRRRTDDKGVERLRVSQESRTDLPPPPPPAAACSWAFLTASFSSAGSSPILYLGTRCWQLMRRRRASG